MIKIGIILGVVLVLVYRFRAPVMQRLRALDYKEVALLVGMVCLISIVSMQGAPEGR
jgi:hypothetical protein